MRLHMDLPEGHQRINPRHLKENLRRTRTRVKQKVQTWILVHGRQSLAGIEVSDFAGKMVERTGSFHFAKFSRIVISAQSDVSTSLNIRSAQVILREHFLSHLIPQSSIFQRHGRQAAQYGVDAVEKHPVSFKGFILKRDAFHCRSISMDDIDLISSAVSENELVWNEAVSETHSPKCKFTGNRWIDIGFVA